MKIFFLFTRSKENDLCKYVDNFWWTIKSGTTIEETIISEIEKNW
jgi:hypothetical protein